MCSYLKEDEMDTAWGRMGGKRNAYRVSVRKARRKETTRKTKT
jgi:hypothetical protein